MNKPNFTLHTEPNASVPEFTISCRTHRGPATNVTWRLNYTVLHNSSAHEISEFINDTYTATIEYTLRVRGRETKGEYNCSIWNNIRYYLPRAKSDVSDTITVRGKITLSYSVQQNQFIFKTVAGEPTDVEATISQHNNTHVNITVSWNPPAEDFTSYVIYYHSKEGPVTSVEMPKTKTNQQLNGLPRSDIYNISMVGLLTDNLPSRLVVANGKSLKYDVLFPAIIYYSYVTL